MRVWAVGLFFPLPGPLRFRLGTKTLTDFSPPKRQAVLSEGRVHPAVHLKRNNNILTLLQSQQDYSKTTDHGYMKRWKDFLGSQKMSPRFFFGKIPEREEPQQIHGLFSWEKPFHMSLWQQSICPQHVHGPPKNVSMCNELWSLYV